MTANWLIDAFAVIGVLASLYWAIGLVLRFLAWIERSELERQAAETAAERGVPKGPAAAPRAATPEASDVTPEQVAAIAAAVAMLGDHRIIHINDDTGARVWTAEGRWRHHTSHQMR